MRTWPLRQLSNPWITPTRADWAPKCSRNARGQEFPQVIYFFDAGFPFWVGCSKFIIFFCMVLIKNDIVNSWISIIYNIKIPSKPCRKKLWILDNLSNREILNNMPFTFVNHDLRKISSDKVTPKWLIIKTFRCHLSLVTFAFTTDFRLGYPVR